MKKLGVKAPKVKKPRMAGTKKGLMARVHTVKKPRMPKL